MRVMRTWSGLWELTSAGRCGHHASHPDQLPRKDYEIVVSHAPRCRKMCCGTYRVFAKNVASSLRTVTIVITVPTTTTTKKKREKKREKEKKKETKTTRENTPSWSTTRKSTMSLTPTFLTANRHHPYPPHAERQHQHQHQHPQPPSWT